MLKFRKIIADEISFFLACPALMWQALFLYLPLCLLILYSVIDFSQTTNGYVFTLKYYLQIIHSSYLSVVLNSFFFALTTAVICLLIAYPVAYFLALKVAKRFRIFFLFSLILPSWTSLVVQVYAWFFLLDKNGFVTRALCAIGVLSESGTLLNSKFAIILGMVSVYLPFMVLPLFAVIEKMDKRILEASADLGASRLETFRRVIFPLSLPGVYSGFLLVFIPAFGEFAIPTLLGGAKVAMWGNVIVEKFLMSRDWRSGAAFASFGILLPLLISAAVYLCIRVIRVARLLRRQRAEQAHKDVW